MANLLDFDLAEMTELGAALRRVGRNAASMEEAAERATKTVYETVVDSAGRPAFALVRCFKTHAYAGLPEDLQAFARKRGEIESPPPLLSCFVLLSSTGVQPSWNSRRDSVRHQAIPLVDESTVARALPMMAGLVHQLGVGVHHVVRPQPGLYLEKSSASFNVFHVPDAHGSPLVPAQESFVVPFGIRSVIGFGGALSNGDIYAMILFSRVPVESQTAQFFKTISLGLKVALIPHERRVFA